MSKLRPREVESIACGHLVRARAGTPVPSVPCCCLYLSLPFILYVLLAWLVLTFQRMNPLQVPRSWHEDTGNTVFVVIRSSYGTCEFRNNFDYDSHSVVMKNLDSTVGFITD